jgi:hypothetical protein
MRLRPLSPLWAGLSREMCRGRAWGDLSAVRSRVRRVEARRTCQTSLRSWRRLAGATGSDRAGQLPHGEARHACRGRPARVGAMGKASRSPPHTVGVTPPSCTHHLAHAKLNGVQRGGLLGQEAVTVSCAGERGHVWDVSLTACARAEGGVAVKDVLDQGAHPRCAAGGRCSHRCWRHGCAAGLVRPPTAKEALSG